MALKMVKKNLKIINFSVYFLFNGPSQIDSRILAKLQFTEFQNNRSLTFNPYLTLGEISKFSKVISLNSSQISLKSII